MTDWVQVVRNTFWSEWFWLAGNTTWRDLENGNDGIYHPQVTDLFTVFPVAVGFFLLRKCFESLVAAPIGIYLGLKDEPNRPAPHNNIMETAFKSGSNPSQREIEGLAKQTDKTTRQVERWFRRRRNQDRPCLLKKFKETCWRFTFFLLAFIYGLVVLWDKIWFWDSMHCWIGHPHHHISSGIYWYYMIELGFYFSLLVTQFSDIKRKDFLESFIHHIATISLMMFSWTGNFVRVGTCVLITHDAVDYWMEGAKLAKYVKAQTLCNILFAIFTVVWFLTRLLLYPYWIVYNTLMKAHTIVGFGPAYYVYNVLLITLQILHIIWFGMICRIIIITFRSGMQVQGDARSDTEEDVSDSGDERTEENHFINNVRTCKGQA